MSWYRSDLNFFQSNLCHDIITEGRLHEYHDNITLANNVLAENLFCNQTWLCDRDFIIASKLTRIWVMFRVEIDQASFLQFSASANLAIYIYIYAYTYTYMYVCVIHIYIYIYIIVYMYMYKYVYECTYKWHPQESCQISLIWTCMYIYIYLCICNIYIYICIYICIYMYMYVYKCSLESCQISFVVE